MKEFLLRNKNNFIFGLIITSIIFLILIIPNSKDNDFNSDNSILISNDINHSNENKSYFIEILGQVNNPGVYEVEGELLVIDAIEIAGGLTQYADLEYVHKVIPLSKKVNPEFKIFIPEINSINSGSNLFSINTCSKEELTSINGIGDVTAKKIIDNRPYLDWDDLKNKTNLKESILESLKLKAII